MTQTDSLSRKITEGKMMATEKDKECFIAELVKQNTTTITGAVRLVEFAGKVWDAARADATEECAKIAEEREKHYDLGIAAKLRFLKRGS